MLAVRADVVVRDGIGYVEVGAGVLGPAAFADMKREAVSGLSRAGVPAVVVADFRLPVVAMTAADLDASYGDGPLHLPRAMALVVAPCYVEVFRRHTWAAAQNGSLRKVFTDMRAAEDWARMRLKLVRLVRTVP